ncbi:MAG: LysE family transporter, partial [Chloroflexota bacterium]
VFATLAATMTLGDSLVLFASGCVAATIAFLFAVAVLGRSVSGLLKNATALQWLNRAVGLFLIAFAASLALGVLVH